MRQTSRSVPNEIPPQRWKWTDRVGHRCLLARHLAPSTRDSSVEPGELWKEQFVLLARAKLTEFPQISNRTLRVACLARCSCCLRLSPLRNWKLTQSRLFRLLSSNSSLESSYHTRLVDHQIHLYESTVRSFFTSVSFQFLISLIQTSKVNLI